MVARLLQGMMTTKELAQHLGVTEHVIHVAVHQGKLRPMERRIGTVMLFDDATVAAAEALRASVDARGRRLPLPEITQRDLESGAFVAVPVAAERLRRSDRQLRRMISGGEVAAGRYKGQTFVKAESVEQIAAARQAESEAA